MIPVRFTRVWISVARDDDENDVMVWADSTEDAAKKRIWALNARDSWLRDRGLKAHVVGEFRMGANDNNIEKAGWSP